MIQVLYVDDEPSVLELLKVYLEQSGNFNVDIITSSHSAIIHLNSKTYDVVISDYIMPEMNGIDLLKTVRSSGNTIPFILFTDKVPEEVIILALNEGADYYIQKGEDPESQFAELARRIRSAVHQKRGDEELRTAYEKHTVQEEELRSQYDELKQISGVLHESEERYRSIVDSIPVGMHFYELKPDGKLIFIGGNSAAESILGFSHNKFIGKSIEDAFPEFGDTTIPEHCRDVINTGKVWRTEQIIRQNGVSDRSYITSAFRTAPNMMVASFLDITDQKRTEEELKSAYEELTAQEEELRSQYESLAISETEWKSTFNGISDWVSLISPDGRIIQSNKAIESLVGISAGDAIDRNCFEIVHGTACSIDDCPRIRMVSSRKREISEIPIQNLDKWFQVTVDPVLNANRDVVSAVHIVRDITESVRSQKALEQAKKKLNFLNRITFNDIQNFVFTLSGYHELLGEMIGESNALSYIRIQKKFLQKINQSLKFAQNFQGLGNKPAKWQDVNLVFLLAISHLDFLNIDHNNLLSNLEIFADPLLEQVFQILAENTLIHGERVTHVTLFYTALSDTLTITYEDDGVGVPKDLKTRIFSPDFQENKSIGLYLAREILEITGIRIQETGEPGKGARFEMLIPPGMWRFIKS